MNRGHGVESAGSRAAPRAIVPIVAVASALVAADSFAQIDFEPPVLWEMSGSEPRDVVVGDFDLDGHLDFAVTGQAAEGEVTTMFGDGLGHFPDNPSFRTLFSAWGLASGDFNDDNTPDFAVTNGGHELTEVGIFVGDGNGGFASHFTAHAGKFPIDIAVGDYNEDTHLDLAVANNVLYGCSILLGHGDGTFDAPLHVPGIAGIMARGIAAGDLNGDQHLDLVISTLNSVWVLIGAGDGTFTAIGTAPVGGAKDVALTDVTGDRVLDLVAFYSTVQIARGHGDGTFSYLTAVGSNLGQSGAVVDFNRDEIPDILSLGGVSNGLTVFLGTGGGAFVPGAAFSTNAVQAALATAGDWNEDGWPDVAVPDRNWGDTAQVSTRLQIPVFPIFLSAPVPGDAGRVNDWTIDGAIPGNRIHLAYALRPGSTNVPGCSGTQLDLHRAKLVGSAITNQDGIAIVRKSVPNAARGLSILFQAVDLGACEVSNRKEHQFN